MSDHLFSLLRELYVNGELFSVPLEGAVGIGVEIAGIVAEHAFALVPSALRFPWGGALVC